jgi:endonuclease/exonuclease/phosphatase family metal-dependent hydrolase
MAKRKVSLKFLTYNIHHGEGMDSRYDYQRLVKTILKEKPDFVSLQEVDKKTRRSNNIDQSKIIGELTGRRSFNHL